LTLYDLSTAPLNLLGAEVVPVRLNHGPRFDVLGFRVGGVAYCTDTNNIPAESRDRLQDLDVLILDALRYKPHPTHYCLDEAVAVAQQLGARRTVFTHISHHLDHDKVNAALPDGMELGYDGMRIPLTFP
jgi:phosphoribosyl 1,2-cyclic phosphate phosphodiesterase